jgi:beta-lactamase superfamily II metal-dependent hydrolase
MASRLKAPVRRKRAAARGQELRVRMYRVGFGDFFLLTLPSDEGPQHILIDCGVTKGTSGKGDIATIKSAVRHMAKETGRKLALIIATHRHQDHIIGFSRCADEFKSFEVGAVWMSRWELARADGQEGEEAENFQSQLSALALGLQKNLTLRGTNDPMARSVLGMLENATGVSLEEGPGGGTNAASLALLKTGLRVKPSYLARGDDAPLPPSLVEAGLTAEILGPPPPDALAFVKLMDLKKGVGQFLDQDRRGDGSPELSSPFGEGCFAEPTDYPDSAFREWRTDRCAAIARIRQVVADSQPEALLAAASQLDRFLNNQSVVVLFTFRGKRLLFAGDAQAGNWEYWLYDLDKPTRTPGDVLSEAGASMLKSLDFYKVGHHGSTNATPIAAVAGMSDGLAAMCSTQGETFGDVDRGTEVPRDPLLEALAKKCESVVRSDHFAVDHEGIKVPAVGGVVTKLPNPARGGRFVAGSCFVDYFL